MGVVGWRLGVWDWDWGKETNTYRTKGPTCVLLYLLYNTYPHQRVCEGAAQSPEQWTVL